MGLVRIKLSDKKLLKLMIRAHEENITFNQFCNKVLENAFRLKSFEKKIKKEVKT